MSGRRKHEASLILLVVTVLVCAGCAWTVPQPAVIREPRVERVPLRISVYYPQQLRDYKFRHHLTDTAFVLGEPSVRLLTDALSLLFLEVLPSAKPGAETSLRADVAGIIEARIVSAGFRYPVFGKEDFFPTHVTYGFTLISRSGETVASWSSTGSGRERVGNPLEGVGTIRRSFEQAMAESAWKLTSEFRDVAGIRQWLEIQGVR